MHFNKNYKINVLLIFFNSFLIFLLGLTDAKSKTDRLDLDYRYLVSELNEFSKIGLFLKNKIYQRNYLENFELTLNNKPHELFIDEYYDSKSFRLYDLKSALRYRSRYKNTSNPNRNIHFKMLSNDQISYIEYKLKVKDEIITNIDFLNFLSSNFNKQNDLIINLADRVNIKSLKYQFSVVQDRDRYYFKNKTGLTIYTISLDRSVFKKDNLNKVANFLEFEINELIYASANEQERKKLLDTINLIIDEIKINFNIEKTDYSKYRFGFDKLEIKNNSINFDTNNFILFIALIFLSLLGIIVLTRRQKL